MDPRTGKAQPLDARILTPTGWKRMGQIQIGDEIVDPDGGTAKVEAIFPQGQKPIYEVTTSDGARAACCKDHLWMVRLLGMEQSYVTLPLGEMMERRFFDEAGRPKFYLPNFTVGREPELTRQLAPTAVHPYVMGVLTAACVWPWAGLVTGVTQSTAAKLRYHLPAGAIFEDGRIINLKHFHPEEAHEYLLLSAKERMLALNGFFDARGSFKWGARSCFLQLNYDPDRRDFIVDLIRSLGGTAQVGKTKFGHTVNASLPFNPFKCKEKEDQFAHSAVTRHIVNVELIGQLEAQCIKVSSHRGLYITDDYLITHNTPTAITAACAALGSGEVSRVVIAYPNSVASTWRKQVRDWAKMPLARTEGRKPLSEESIAEVKKRKMLFLGVHYEILGAQASSLLAALDGSKFMLVADEIQLAKNRNAAATKGLLQLAHAPNCVYRIGATGTPMRNRPRDLWAVFEFLSQGSMGGYWSFAKRYAAAEQGTYGWTDLGCSNEGELARRLAAVSYRKTRAQVASWLPQSDRKIILCDVTDPKLQQRYKRLEKEHGKRIIAALDAGGDSLPAGTRALLETLTEITSAAKLPTALERLDYHVGRGVKVVLFTHFHEPLRNVADEWIRQNPDIPAYVAGDGLLAAKRAKVIAEWQAAPYPAILFANTMSAGVGIDLADAEVAIFLELEWVPADFQQAMDRLQDIHLGKRTTPALYEFLLVRNTIDEAMAKVLLTKLRAIEAVVGHNPVNTDLSTSLRSSGLVNTSELGLMNSDESTIRAALASVRERMRTGTSTSKERQTAVLDFAEGDDEHSDEDRFDD